MKDTYRRDIDGLRAIAVFAVILCHLNESWLPGGFIGVDIFFTISGYLISRHIFMELEGGKFSLKDFYRRRVNRIMPALYGIIFVVTVAAGLFYLPDDFNRVAQSAIEALAYKVNFYFAGKADYFAAATSQLPFLHLWSLSVEEQFYLFLPALLVCISKYCSKKMRIWTVAGLFFLLFAVCELHIAFLDPKLSFFSIFTRVPELLLGTLLADWTLKNRKVLAPHGLGVLGLIVIIGSCFLINAKSRLPGAVVMIPCLGTALIIYSGQRSDSIVARLLSLRPIVVGGMISYSLYLYHWPIMAIVRHVSPEQKFSAATVLSILTSSIVLAILSYRYIEMPFRKHQSNFKSVVIWRLVAPTAVLLGALFAITATRGLPQRYGKNAVHLQELKYLSEKYCHNHFKEYDCKFGAAEMAPEVLLLGDSHGGHFQPVLDEVGKTLGFSFTARTTDGCVPIVKFPDQKLDFNESKKCLEQIAWSESAVPKYKTFILAANWSSRTKNDFSPRYLVELAKSVKRLVASGKKVVFIEQTPDCRGIVQYNSLRFSPWPWPLSSPIRCGIEGPKANAYFEAFAKENGAIFSAPISEFVKSNPTFPIVDGKSLYKDDTHFNEVGGKLVGQWLAGHSQEIFKLRLNNR